MPINNHMDHFHWVCSLTSMVGPKPWLSIKVLKLFFRPPNMLTCPPKLSFCALYKDQKLRSELFGRYLLIDSFWKKSSNHLSDCNFQTKINFAINTYAKRIFAESHKFSGPWNISKNFVYKLKLVSTSQLLWKLTHFTFT
jgi:hypothetical protein